MRLSRATLSGGRGADSWLDNTDRSSEAAAAAAKFVQDELDQGRGWISGEDTYGAMDAANCAEAVALVLPGSLTKSMYGLMALEAGRKSSADAIADDAGKAEEVEQQYSELLTIIQEIRS